jgi:hypothetical protein
MAKVQDQPRPFSCLLDRLQLKKYVVVLPSGIFAADVLKCETRGLDIGSASWSRGPPTFLCANSRFNFNFFALMDYTLPKRNKWLAP